MSLDVLDAKEKKEFWTIMLIPFMMIFTIIVALMGYVAYSTSAGDTIYLYIDLDGNKGIAEECSTNAGMMWCKKGNIQITVREYWSNESYMEEGE